MVLLTMIARQQDGLPLAASVQEDEQVRFMFSSSASRGNLKQFHYRTISLVSPPSKIMLRVILDPVHRQQSLKRQHFPMLIVIWYKNNVLRWYYISDCPPTGRATFRSVGLTFLKRVNRFVLCSALLLLEATSSNIRTVVPSAIPARSCSELTSTNSRPRLRNR